jgi:dUTP pyrophosphatase
MISIRVQRLHPQAMIPRYAHEGDAGCDLHSVEEVTIQPGARALVATGIALEIPLGYVGLVHPRSGLAIKNGMSLVNAPGTIDAGYRGEIKVILINHDQVDAFTVHVGDRIAQLVLQEVAQATFEEVADLSHSQRGEGGFGSSGVGQ